MREASKQTVGQEIFNAITHGIGAALAIAGLVILIIMAAAEGGALRVTAVTIYGISLVVLYLASTLYHSLHVPRVKRIFEIIDHAAIFALIAGSYTPYLLILFPEHPIWGWPAFFAIWTLAVAGILFKSFYTGRYDFISTMIYIAMGWICLFAIYDIYHALEFGGVVLLVAGGLAYTVGTIFYLWERFWAHHAIWHFFVLAGSTFHFFSVLFYVVPV